jgi:hypothetical protein
LSLSADFSFVIAVLVHALPQTDIADLISSNSFDVSAYFLVISAYSGTCSVIASFMLFATFVENLSDFANSGVHLK